MTRKQGGLFEAPATEYLVPFDGSVRIDEASIAAKTGSHRHEGKRRRRATDALR